MKSLKLLLLSGVVSCFAVFLFGCASSKLVDVWTVSPSHTPAMSKMLVISVGKTAARRRIWEDQFVAELGKHNTSATASYTLFPDAAPDTVQVLEAVRSNNYDGVLVTRWLPPETNAEVSQGFYSREPNTRYDYRRERFVTYYRTVEHVAYIDSQKVDLRAFDVWTTKEDGQLIWSATSKTPDSNGASNDRPEIAKLVTDELSGNGIIGPEQK